jgi:hypothetical protein
MIEAQIRPMIGMSLAGTGCRSQSDPCRGIIDNLAGGGFGQVRWIDTSLYLERLLETGIDSIMF